MKRMSLSLGQCAHIVSLGHVVYDEVAGSRPPTHTKACVQRAAGAQPQGLDKAAVWQLSAQSLLLRSCRVQRITAAPSRMSTSVCILCTSRTPQGVALWVNLASK